jgi:hypothetical protein
LQQRRVLGSSRAPFGRPEEYLSIDIRRHPLDDDQLTTQFFETVVIETKAELNPAKEMQPSVTRRQRTFRSTRSKFMRLPPSTALFDPTPESPSRSRYPYSPLCPLGAEADIEWLRARRVGKTMPTTDAGTLVSEMRDEGER